MVAVDFMEVIMDNLIFEKIQNFERTQERYEKCQKINSCLEFIIQYYAMLYYCHVRRKGKINKQLVEVILTDFYKKNPLLGSWIKLLKVSIDLLGLKINVPAAQGKLLQELSIKFLPDSNRKPINENPKYKELLDAISILRNKVFAHSANISEDNIDTLLSFNFDKAPYFFDEVFSLQTNYKIVYVDSMSRPDDNEMEISILNYTNQIIKSEKIKIDRSKEIYTNIFYYVEKDEWISLSPFLISRDSHAAIYSSVDNKSHPVYCFLDQSKYIAIRNLEYAFKQLVETDIDLINVNELKINLKFENDVYHNLPDPTYKQFIGRIDSLDRIDKAIKNRRIFLLSISGIGGVGKTAIAVKKAYDLLKDKKFEFIIWVSAKKTYLTSKGIVEEEQSFTSLIQLLDVILRVSGFSEDLHLSYVNKKETVLNILNAASFLLVVDNFETISNPTEFLSFFEEIGDRCESTKIIITTRRQLGTTEKLVELKEFSAEEYNIFIDYLSSEKFMHNFVIPNHAKEKLYRFSGGVPLASEYILSRVNLIDDIDKIIKKIENKNVDKENILEFSYTETFNALLKEEKQVLFTISMLEQPTINSICFITGLDEFDVEEIIKSKLQLYSLVNENYENNNLYYSVLPLTKIFLSKKIDESRDIKEYILARIEEYKMILSISSKMRDEKESLSIPVADSVAFKFAKAGYFLATHMELSKAEECFNAAIRNNNKDPWVWYYWAIAERDASNSIKDEYFEKAVQFASDQSNKIKILTEWADTLYNNKRLKDAISIYNEIIQIDRKNNSIWHKAGKAYYEIGHNLWQKGNKIEERKNYKMAIDAFGLSIYERPQNEFEKNHNTIGYYFLAKIYRFSGDLGKAKENIKMGLSLQPYNYRLQEFLDEIEKRLNSK
jgi:tetratricopeptide (TPR) repeat protein